MQWLVHPRSVHQLEGALVLFVIVSILGAGPELGAVLICSEREAEDRGKVKDSVGKVLDSVSKVVDSMVATPTQPKSAWRLPVRHLHGGELVQYVARWYLVV